MDWIKTSERLPEKGIEVETKLDDKYGVRKEQQLVLKGHLWFYPDRSMYVYYTPTHWKPIVLSETE